MFLGQLLCLFFVSPVQWTCSSTRDKGLPLMVLYVACPCSTLLNPHSRPCSQPMLVLMGSPVPFKYMSLVPGLYSAKSTGSAMGCRGVWCCPRPPSPLPSRSGWPAPSLGFRGVGSTLAGRVCTWRARGSPVLTWCPPESHPGGLWLGKARQQPGGRVSLARRLPPG